jgi:hypothetical protein
MREKNLAADYADERGSERNRDVVPLIQIRVIRVCPRLSFYRRQGSEARRR